jgi:hypothetical protein
VITFLKVAGGLILAFVLISATGVFLPKPGTPEHSKMVARDAIDLCWDEQKRKSLSPDQARFYASTCESMEAKYRTEYKANP